jgi:hypothetical protein
MKILLSFLLFGLLLVSCGTTKNASNQKDVSFSGGNGLLYSTAVVVNAKNESSGVAAEYTWLKANYPGYKVEKQAMINHEGKLYDKMDIVTSNGRNKTIYFDITFFYGKF